MSTPNMGLTLPVDHGSADVWDTILDTVFGLIDPHDHTTGKGVKVPSAGLNINADVAWGSHAATGLLGVQFTEQVPSALAGYASAFFVSNVDHNLYFRNANGVNVQFSAGNTLNVSIVGGIGGDYASVGALFSFDDATKRYLAQSEGSPRPWSGLAVADIDLYEKAASITNKVTLKSPAGLAASYAVTWPAAAPVVTSLMTMTVAGAISVTNNVTRNRTLTIPGSSSVGTAALESGPSTGAFGRDFALATPVTYPIPIEVGDVITGYTLDVNKVTSGATTISCGLYSYTASTLTELSATALKTSAANAPGFITLTDSALGLVGATGVQ
jgi:hypothetical protein